MMRSTPLRELTSSWTASSSAVSFLEEAANADIETFRVLAEDHEAHVVSGTVAKRRKPVVEKFNRASIHKEVELEAKSEKDVRRVLIGWNARIAERTEKNRIEFFAEHF